MVTMRLAFGTSRGGGVLGEGSGNSCQEDECDFHIERIEDSNRRGGKGAQRQWQWENDASFSRESLKLGGERS